MPKSSKTSITIKNPLGKATPPPQIKEADTMLSSIEAGQMSSDYDDIEESIPPRLEVWGYLDDIILEIKYFEDEMRPYKDAVQIENYSFQKAKRYLQSFIDNGREYELCAVYELIKVHNMMMLDKSHE